MQRRPQIGVIGPATAAAETLTLAEEVGAEIGRQGAVLICGGLGGLMEAAARGAKRVGGLTIGILPGVRAHEANEFIDVPVVTGMGEGRNVLVVRSSNAVIAVAGSYGTLSEIALALKLEIPVVGLGTWRLRDPEGNEPPIICASTPQQAVAQAFKAMRS
ncbi:MAG TPA: TIGR00725 family protein [Verrucomicrobiae bacterium]|nr:TIGR00725 family protein [Verrucomicrobiae bacterium]